MNEIIIVNFGIFAENTYYFQHLTTYNVPYKTTSFAGIWLSRIDSLILANEIWISDFK